MGHFLAISMEQGILDRLQAAKEKYEPKTQTYV